MRRCEDDAPVLDCALCVYDARYDVFDTECRDATYDFARLQGHYVPACWYDTGDDSSASLCGVGDTPLPPPPSPCDLDDVYCQGETLRACADGAAVLDCRTCAAAGGAHTSCVDAAWSYGTFGGRLTAGCYTIESSETSTTLHSECFPDSGSGGSAGSGGSGGSGGSNGTNGCVFDTECGYHEACVGGDCEYVDCTNDAHCSDCYRCGDDNRCRYCGEGPYGCYC